MARLKWLAIGILAIFCGLGSALAADMGGSVPSYRSVESVGANCQRIQTCQGEICRWKKVCWRGCSDRYSCTPLYGAYGPWGGSSYWAAYSYGDLRPY